MLNISESLRKQREQSLEDGSEEALSRHTSLLEIALISLYNRLANRLDLDAEQFRASGAILALGSFGRGLIGPNQSIPILFLTLESSSWKDNWLEEITGPLTEAGWRLEAEQAHIEPLIARARDDVSFLLRLLEARFISGNRQLAEQLDQALASLIEGRQDELLGRLYGAVEARELLREDPESWLEPDLEHNPGGLAEISAVRAACRIASNIRTLEDAIFRGYLVRQEVDLLQQSEKTLVRLLNLLRSLTGEPATALRFDDQEALARKLGYSARVGFLPVEAFMQQVFQLLHGVSCIAHEFWERLQETRIAEEGSAMGAAETLENGVLVRSGKIYIQTDRYPATAAHIVHLFSLAAQRGLGFANVTRQWIWHHRNALDTASGDPNVREEFLTLLLADSEGLPVVRRFYNLGLMTSLIPELSTVHGLAQHDAFHLYPVHEHHLRTVSELKRLFAGAYADPEPELTLVAQGLTDRTWLLLAGLLHDIGKSSGSGHAQHGGELIPTIGRRLGLGSEATDLVQFLVAQHLLLLDSASLRDLADEEMLKRCAQAVAAPERLDVLALLSMADLAATGPKGQQKWRDTPVIVLYEKIQHLLERGEPSPQAIAERIEFIRTQVAQEVADFLDDSALEKSFSQLAPRYLLSTPPAAIARHLRLQRRLLDGAQPLVMEVGNTGGLVELTVMSWESAGLLARVAGILSLHDLNIISAQVYAMTPEMALLIFQCRLPAPAGSPPAWEAVRQDMQRLIQGKLALDYRIASRAERLTPAPVTARSTPSKILIDNDASAMYTILEVYTVDRVGLLYTISRTLYELQIRIFVAKITTKADQVADVFYLRTHQGEKVTDPEQIGEIQNALLYWLDGTRSA